MKHTIISNDLRNYVINKYPNNSSKSGGTMPSLTDTVNIMQAKSLPAKFPFKFNLNSFIIVLLAAWLLASCSTTQKSYSDNYQFKSCTGKGRINHGKAY